ncbi:mediator of RNA polymerase II transcription subunit 25-like isoform X2 [Hydractinia symbiolongicarpus]|uniref:mediator of RNA polymerase II transcription subunit 25-like isoform X2 n=1 Tax=Hydractinia symbiolongicarpus TaxID=13093 RepID=UPI0025513175|nr:mediator of RNA polymerase II transcription subunit 25-like isoform X2 [Hydractinia symbiolongicarpus]
MLITEKLHDVIFVIESSVINGEHFEEIKKSYLFPIITLDGGGLTNCSLLGEGLAVALQTFEDIAKPRESNSNIVRHCIVVANAPPYNLPVLGNNAYNGTSFDSLLDLFVKRSIHLSLICSRCVPQFKDLVMKTSRNDAAEVISQSSKYATHSNHMVFLKGIKLPLQDTSVSDQTVKLEPSFATKNKNTEQDPNPHPQKRMKQEEPVQTSFMQPNSNQPPGNINMSAYLQTGNSASLQGAMTAEVMTNIAKTNRPLQPSFETQSVSSSQTINISAGDTPLVRTALVQPQLIPQPHQPAQQVPQHGERKLAWIGRLQWQETTVSGNESGKSISRLLECKATIAKNEELKTDVWPQVLHMQLIPQTYLQTLSDFLKHAKIIIFHFTSSDSETLQAMYRVMNGAGPAGNPGGGTGQKFAGCVILKPPSPPDPNHVRVLLLMYSPKKKAFIGIIPEQQQNFVNRLGAIISQDKNQMTNKTNDMNMMTRNVRAPVMNPQIPSSNPQMNPAQLLARQHQLQFANPLRNLLTGGDLMASKQQLLMQQQQSQQQQVSLPQQTQQMVSQLPWSNQQQQQQQFRQQYMLQQQQQQQQQQQRQVAMALAQQQQQQQPQQQQLTDPIYSDFLGTG